MSADLDNQPYDNVEFPIRRPAPGTQGGWVSPNLSQAQREHLVMGSMTRERTHTLPPVAEGGPTEEEGEESEVKVEDQRQKVGTSTTYTSGSTTATSQFNNVSLVK